MNFYYTIIIDENKYGIIIEKPKDSNNFTLMFINLDKKYALGLVDVLNKEEIV